MIILKLINTIFVIWFLVLNVVKCAKILSIFPYAGPSQYICVQPYLKMLAARGHEITSVSAFPQKTPIKNFRDIVIKTENSKHDEFMQAGAENADDGKLVQLRASWMYSSITTLLLYKTEEFQQLLSSKEHFDLIIIEVLYLESLYVLGEHFKAPMIGVSTIGADAVIDQLIDNISPVSYVPVPSSKHLVRNFWQRLDNLLSYTMQLLYHHLVIIPDQQQIYETYFPNATSVNLREVRRDFSLLLLNQYHSIDFARPCVQNAIEVAGMHIDHKPQRLPEDMEAFINASSNGVIYFSLGSNVKSAFLSKTKLATILNVFASLPVNVLWKFENSNLPGKPKNVYISKWFPQSDILAHPKVKLFITHCGMHSYIETIHFGKPIVGTPVFYDQHLNAARAEAKGLGLTVSLRNLKQDKFRNAILEVLNNPKYAEKVQEMSAIYHDRPMNPLDTAIYWTEYVLRHKGAPQLRVPARQLNFLQRNNVDTMVVLFGIPLLLAIFLIVLIYKLIKSIFYVNYKKRGGKRDKPKMK